MALFDADAAIEFLSGLTLDSGEAWVVEPFQEAIIRDIASGVSKVWVIIPEANAKTTLMAGVALAAARQNEMASIPVAAASREQAGLLYTQAMELVLRANIGTLTTKFPQHKKDEFRISEGNRRIEHRATGSRIKVQAADDRTGDGAIIDMAFIDELHRHRDLRLYRTWAGKLQKRGGQMIVISTAGEPGSEFEQTRERMKAAGTAERDGRHVRVVGEDTIIHEWALEVDDDPEDFELVKLANPLSTITVEGLAQKHRSPEMTAPHWSRFVTNVATSAEGSWLPVGAWEACLAPDAAVDESLPVFLGLDVGLKGDATAIAIVQPQDDKLVVSAQVYEPPAGDGELELSFIEAEIRALCGRYEVVRVAYDPWGFKRSAELLEDEGIPMVKVPMTNERIVPASRDLLDAVVSRRIQHAGDQVLSAHVAAGVAQETSRGWRIGKRSTLAPIDALVAMLLAFTQANTYEGSPVLEWIA